ncbi:Uncharacterised protein [Acinetobacter baumannii]|nr:Uncharacterised protein [Acinetobacter baumannii]
MLPSSHEIASFDAHAVVAISATVEGAGIDVNVAFLKLIGFDGVTIDESLSLSLQPANVAAVAIAPNGRKGIPVNHFKISRRVGWLEAVVIINP